MDPIRHDLNERVKERLLRWVDDSQDLYEMAELRDGRAFAHMCYCLFCALTAMLVKAGVSKAEACRMLLAMMDRTQNVANRQEGIEL